MMLGEDETVEDEGAFHKKGVWARFSVIFAGAFFNFLFAFILSLILLGDLGVDKPFVSEVKSNSVADGKLKKGDVITKIDGSTVHFGREIGYHFYFHPLSGDPITVTYLRDGKKNNVVVTPEWKDTYLLGCRYSDVSKTARLTEVSKDYPLALAGLSAGDDIVAIDGTEITSGMELKDYFNKNPLSNKEVSLTYRKGGEGSPVTVRVTPKLVDSSYTIGFDYNLMRYKVSPIQVVKYSVYEVNLNIVNTIKSVFALATGKVSLKEIAGPVGIVNYVGDVVTESKGYGIRIMLLSLIDFSILISANLGVMNLLPLPALDGGRLVFLLIEAIRRKPVPKEKEAMVHMVGMALLMILMVFVLFNDIRNIVG